MLKLLIFIAQKCITTHFEALSVTKLSTQRSFEISRHGELSQTKTNKPKQTNLTNLTMCKGCSCGWAVALGLGLLVVDVGLLASAAGGSPEDGFGLGARDLTRSQFCFYLSGHSEEKGDGKNLLILPQLPQLCLPGQVLP